MLLVEPNDVKQRHYPVHSFLIRMAGLLETWSHARHFTRRYCCHAVPFVYHTLVQRLSMYVYDTVVGTFERDCGIDLCFVLLNDYYFFLKELKGELALKHLHQTICADCCQDQMNEIDDLSPILDRMRTEEIYLLIFVKDSSGDTEHSIPLFAEDLVHRTDCGLESRWSKHQERLARRFSNPEVSTSRRSKPP